MGTILNRPQGYIVTINIPTGYAQATLTYSGPTVSGKAATVLGFSLGEEGTLTGLVDGLEAAFIAHLSAIQHDSFTLTNIRAVDNENVHEKSVSIEGNASSDLAPPNVALLIKKTSNLRGRQHRGRNYWPGFLFDGYIRDDGTISPVEVAGLDTAFSDFNDELVGLGYFPTILHNDPGTTPTAVTGGGIESRVATQRRRLR